MQFTTEEVLSVVLLKLTFGEIQLLSKTCKDTKAATTKLLNTNYMWKLIFEQCFNNGIKLPTDYEVNYRECYHIYNSKPNRILIMFTRDISHLKLGLHMNPTITEKELDKVTDCASIDTVEYLMRYDKLPSNIWNSLIPFKNAIYCRRTDLALLYIKDGRCFNNDINLISDALVTSAEAGMSTAFFHLLKTYPALKSRKNRYSINSIACAGGKDILTYLLSSKTIVGGVIEEAAVLDLIDGYKINVFSEFAIMGLFENGYIAEAIEMLKNVKSRDVDSIKYRVPILIRDSISNGKVNTLGKFRLLVNNSFLLPYDAISWCIRILRVDLIDKANTLILDLLKIYSLSASEIDDLSREARRLSKLTLSNQILSMLK